METAWKWRDEPAVPPSYDDLHEFVRVARQARGRWVEFEWRVTADELASVRRAVLEWTAKTTGRYRSFDARMVAAMNAAQCDAGAPTLVDARPDDAAGGRVACAAVDGGYQLTGSATFDILFGYASAGADPTLPGAIHLTADVADALVDGFRALGWDVRRLADERHQPVRNVLYGLNLRQGAHDVGAVGEPLVVNARFDGPFSLFAADDQAPCLFGHEVTSRSGVYLWTLHTAEGFRPWYVGQTRRGFGQRTAEHVAGYLSGQYPAYDVQALARGEHRVVAPDAAATWPTSLPTFLEAAPTLMPRIVDLLRATRLFVAPLDPTAQVLDRVEGALGRHYKRTPELATYLIPGQRMPDAIPGDRPLVLHLASAATILGLPSELLEPQ